ncbi:MAG: hypothetical protein MNPFHGCM_02531 [Gemmatimonadaceae bacterium]|nr:hypothetical protein [Gemmatimonadaceae bacterium]
MQTDLLELIVRATVRSLFDVRVGGVGEMCRVVETRLLSAGVDVSLQRLDSLRLAVELPSRS